MSEYRLDNYKENVMEKNSTKKVVEIVELDKDALGNLDSLSMCANTVAAKKRKR